MFNVYELFNKINEVKPEIRLDAGQPDIPVANEIIEEAINSLKRGETGYVSTTGINELREKIAEVEGVSKEEVIVGPGAKILIAAEIAMANKIGVIAPYWNAYLLIAKNFEKEVKIIETTLENSWEPEINDNLDVDLLILNYPNNPTGKILPREKLKELVEVAEEKGIKILSDEIYAEISFKSFTPVRELYENTVTVKGFSKLYSMTGFRLGYAIADKEEIRKIKTFIESTVTCVPPFVQRAGIKALELRDELMKKVSREYKRRAELASKILRGLEFYEPDGAFYIFLKTPIDGLEFVYKLLERGVSAFPGIAFGNYQNFIRISLTSDKLEKGLNIIKEVAECESQ
ncbi:aspartate aminotransferase [Pyrococcus furiosus DSM 3638]|uniref:Aminotransferase n=3 Tax=Pyrococcus furiosus TaxID=2261 RepID=Q8U097_PYRFU|nr:aminotransferase class I/II-fold pyridoxal phosphate-dependent enzyme [Pyrococcus furiosus]AAL81826.1 aspartate aminotransferase [Pyrococcus furiosus DSM 3638]AFN04938.1 aspartate aminotransferase [Pyrococcus furiosus COM1]QEK79319.1 aspartate aminotransferase [Pyrococcus furiosus DSM 3638]